MLKLLTRLIALVSVCSQVSATPVDPSYAKRAADRAQISTTDSTLERVMKVIKLQATGMLFRNAGPNPPSGGSELYDKDANRSAEQMLEKCDGASCNSFAVTSAAILEASGVPAADIRVVNAINAHEFLEVCKGEKGSAREKRPETGATGHSTLLVRTGKNEWKMVNTSHHPLMQPVNPSSAAITTYHSLRDGCMDRFGIKDWPSKDAKPPKKFFDCIGEAEQEGMRRLQVTDFEITPSVSPDELEASMSKGPTELPVTGFPSVLEWMTSANIPPKQIIFGAWKLEDYPQHRLADRYNLVASGTVRSDKCRWSSTQVKNLISETKVRPKGPGAPGEDSSSDPAI